MQTASMDAAADLNDWEQIRRFIDQFCQRHDVGGEICSRLQLACEEWFINVVVHGFKEQSRTESGDQPFIRLIFSFSEPGEITAQLLDNGPAFNPLEYEMPDITLSAAERSIGGLGVYLMLKQADRSTYQRTEGRNELTLWIGCEPDKQQEREL